MVTGASEPLKALAKRVLGRDYPDDLDPRRFDSHGQKRPGQGSFTWESLGKARLHIGMQTFVFVYVVLRTYLPILLQNLSYSILCNQMQQAASVRIEMFNVQLTIDKKQLFTIQS